MLTLLAIAHEAPPFEILGDVPLAAQAHVPAWVMYLAPVVAYAIFSGAVGGLNQVIRQRDLDGVPVSPRLRLMAAVLNAMAANWDKTREQAGKAKVTP